MTLSTKYLNKVAWRTYFKGVSINSYETSENGAKWDVTVYPIDDNDKGANPMILNTSLFIVDNAGHMFSISAINVGSDPYRITVSDDFKCGFAPVMGYEGYVYESAYKGYAPFISPVLINRLDKSAMDYINKLEKSILWQNDPNARRIPFTDIEQVSIPNYRANLVDENGVTFNPYEDYGSDAKFEIWQKTSDTTYSKLQIEPEKTFSAVDGGLNSVLWSSTGETISGRIIISR